MVEKWGNVAMFLEETMESAHVENNRWNNRLTNTKKFAKLDTLKKTNILLTTLPDIQDQSELYSSEPRKFSEETKLKRGIKRAFKHQTELDRITSIMDEINTFIETNNMNIIE
jgi:hypothetical protein